MIGDRFPWLNIDAVDDALIGPGTWAVPLALWAWISFPGRPIAWISLGAVPVLYLMIYAYAAYPEFLDDPRQAPLSGRLILAVPMIAFSSLFAWIAWKSDQWYIWLLPVVFVYTLLALLVGKR